MDIFQLRKRVIRDYEEFIRSFVTIREPRIDKKVQDALRDGLLWPDPLVQLNPRFEPGDSIASLIADGTLHAECARIFRRKPDASADLGPLTLHRHQVEAIRAARRAENYVLTTGTGSGKSLSYIVPIVDHVLREGSGKGVRAIVVYPMNALANSQEIELQKFLCHGYAEGRSPVTFRRYTGQETDAEREVIRAHPPDIILTNYAMLELVLTRPKERTLVDAASALRFIVLDELHTHRGRQGADVAMLLRRLRNRSGAQGILHVGTSATLANDGTWADQQRAVARVAELTFGVPFGPASIIGETLRRNTAFIDFSKPPSLEALRERVQAGTSPTSATAFLADPLASWVETTLGLEAEPETARLRRRPPQSLRGQQGACQLLATQVELDPAVCENALSEVLMTGASLSDQNGFPLFAFRLHQFISKGEAVYASIGTETDRFLTLNGQRYVPESEKNDILLPLAFCRECGQEYYVVRRTYDDDGRERFVLRELSDQAEDDDGQPGFLYISVRAPWPTDRVELEQRLPDDWLERDKRGQPRVRKSRRLDVPAPVTVAATGHADPKGLAGHYIKSPFRFCLSCGVSYNPRQRSDFGKLATLGSEGRSSATTVLTLSAVRRLRAEQESQPDTRKLLSFTDNRQDASLQAGHFNDFVEISQLRAALYKAAVEAGEEGLQHETLTRDVFKALALPMREYALQPDVEFLQKDNTEKALRRVLGYYLYVDLRRGWRITQPNLEQVGLLQIDYLSLRELCHAQPKWENLKRAADRLDPVHAALAGASPEERIRICRTLLDFMRKELAIQVDFLDPAAQEGIRQLSSQYLVPPWALPDSSERLEQHRYLVPASRGDLDEERFELVFLSPRGGLGSFLKKPGVLPSHTDTFSEDDVRQILVDLLDVLAGAGIVRPVIKVKEFQGYQLNASAIVWRAASGEQAYLDPIRVPNAPEGGLRPNPFFKDFYRGGTRDLIGLTAREHTAQVDAQQRAEREGKFRTAEIPILFCSPTLELGVDIRDLNVVNMRNVPPTPANYAQRSGRAGRGGQPAFVFTYCGGSSAHDQYFFRRPEKMVGGAVAPPRLDLANEDLLRAHVHAIWLAEATLDLGNTLVEILDCSGDNPSFAFREHVVACLRSETAKARAVARSQACMGQALQELSGSESAAAKWLEETIAAIPDALRTACDRWVGLYRAALLQHKSQSEISRDASRDAQARQNAQRLAQEAKNQLDLLIEGENRVHSDFYSYRYFASEGFLPGYNFPRLPLSAYLPARRRQRGDNDEMLSRPRFLAITEFGPRAFIYHEGARYSINRVILPVSSDGALKTSAVQCAACGYLHPVHSGDPPPDLCERCRKPLPAAWDNLFRMQNVSTRRRDRINSDEEERMRIGYEIRTGVRFANRAGVPSEKTVPLLAADGRPLADLVYGAAATLWRMNVGWRRRKEKHVLGFNLDLDRGYWARKDSEHTEEDDPPDPESPNKCRVIPFVEDRRNCLLVVPREKLDNEQMASLQAALKTAIQVEYQLEDGELAAEPLPSQEDRRLLLFYEASEGGAGVLRQLIEDSGAMARVGRTALQICHFDPTTGDDEGSYPGSERCKAACYDCLLSYYNQRDHGLLDRHCILPVLLPWITAKAVSKDPPAQKNAASMANAVGREGGAHSRWLRYLADRELRHPDRLAHEVAGHKVDFFYESAAVAVVLADASDRDAAKAMAADLEDIGIGLVVFGPEATWEETFARYRNVFGLVGAVRAAGTRLTREVSPALELADYDDEWHPLLRALAGRPDVHVSPGGDVAESGRTIGAYVAHLRLGQADLCLVDDRTVNAAVVVRALEGQGRPARLANPGNLDLDSILGPSRAK